MAELTLVAFINARYDEKELVANAADAAYWQAQGGAVWDERNGSVVAGFTRVYPETAIELDEGDARHIALNDPAAALADIAIKRRILDEHKMTVERQQRFPFDPYTGRPSVEAFDVTCSACGWASDDPTSACLTVRLLGSEFDTHPDCQERWKP